MKIIKALLCLSVVALMAAPSLAQCSGGASYAPPAYTPPVYNPPAYHPPVYTTPVYTPPVHNQPVYTPPAHTPIYTPPAHNPPAYTPPVYNPPGTGWVPAPPSNGSIPGQVIPPAVDLVGPENPGVTQPTPAMATIPNSGAGITTQSAAQVIEPGN